MRKMMSSMKKVTAVAMTAAMCISLTGCGGGSSKKTVVTEAVKQKQKVQRKQKLFQRKSQVSMILRWQVFWQEPPGRGFPASRRSW